jgi:hypothetical protein
MSEFDPKSEPLEDDPIVFDLDDVVSSGSFLKKEPSTGANVLELTSSRAESGEKDEGPSPVMKELASVELPELEKENRARLQMQTPNRLFFYWSIKNNPFQMLNRAFGGDTGSYTLVAKLVNLTRDTEEIHQVEAEGSWWFSVDADSSYRAEIGFYAPNRPYVRAMFSNTVTTPRKRPSPRAATSADWHLTAKSFAQVLDVSGFKQDAFEVALAGDAPQTTQPVSYEPFARFVERDYSDFAGIASDELRYALVLIASGLSIEHLRYRIDATLFALLQASAAKLSAENALAVLKEQFGIEADVTMEEEASNAVYGASLVNFPRHLKQKRTLHEPSEYQPVSSPTR